MFSSHVTSFWVLRHWISDTHVSEVQHDGWVAGQRAPEHNFKQVSFRFAFGPGALNLAVNIPLLGVLPLQRAHAVHHEEGRW